MRVSKLLRNEIERYTNLTGENGWCVPIMKVGAYLDGYDKGLEVLDKIRSEMHATVEKHEDGVYYLRDEWIDEIIDKYAEEGKA